MNTREHTWNLQILIWWIIIIAGACIVYATGISHEDLWFDESYSVAMSEHSFGQIITLAAIDNHPPLYYLLLRTVRAVLGSSEWALRTLSVAGAVALVGLGAGPVRRIFGDKTAFIYAAVTIFTPGILIYAHEARMYTLAIFTVTASALYGYLAVQHNRTSDWVYFGLASLAAAYLHYYGLMAAFFTHLFILLWIFFKKRAYLKAYIFAGGAVLAGYLPWLAIFIKQIKDTARAFWIPPVNTQAILESFHTPFAYKYFFPDTYPVMSAALLFSLAMIISGIIIAKMKKRESELMFSLFLLFVNLCALITPIVISRILTPVFLPRYTIVYAGLFLLLLSSGISLLPAKPLQLTAVGIFALLNAFTIKDVYTQQFNGPIKEMSIDHQGEIQPGDLIITSDSFSMGPMLYYFPEAVHYHSVNDTESQWERIFIPFADHLQDEDNLDELLSAHQSFWYITSNAGFSKNVRTILKAKDGWEETIESKTYSDPFSLFAFTVSKYEYTGRESERQQGTLNVHITGLRPVGYIYFSLYDHGPLSRTAPIYRWGEGPVTGDEMLYTFDGLEYGEYVLVVAHDENDNRIHDFDSDGLLPIEGTFVLNMDVGGGLEDFIFEDLKFSFDEPEQTIEAEMQYPPFGRK